MRSETSLHLLVAYENETKKHQHQKNNPLHTPKELLDFSFVNATQGDVADRMHSNTATNQQIRTPTIQ